jgi:hypothetical protein
MSNINVNMPSSELAPSIADLDDAQLSTFRWQLQSEISSLSSEAQDNVELQSKKILYNQVMDALHVRQICPQGLDPLDRLPHELIVAILLDILAYGIHWYSTGSIQNLLPLATVSKKWQRFILSEPLLWNHIVLDGSYDMANIIAVHLRLSSTLPLTIQVQLPFDRWDLCPVLEERTERIEAVISCGGYPSHTYRQDGEDTDLHTFLNSLGTLPNLRHVGYYNIFDRRSYNVTKLLDRYLSLDRLSGMWLTIQDLRVSRDRLVVETFKTCEDVRAILPIVEKMEGIREVGFHPSYSQLQQEHTNVNNSTNESISQLGWTVLDYRADYPRIPSSLLCRLTSLVRLNLDVDVKSLNTVAAALHQLKSLDSLSISFKSKLRNDAILSSDFSINRSVRSLAIYTPSDNLRYDPPEESDQLNNGVVEVITKTLLRIMPNLQSLSITDNTCGPVLSLSSLEGLFSGDYLSLDISHNSIPKPNINPIPSSVKMFYLSSDRNIACSFSSVSTRDLTISPPFIQSDNGKEIDLNRWEALEEIDVYSGLVTWSKYSLLFLRSVDIGMEDTRYGSLKITSFIKDIAFRPDYYPSLEEIRLATGPEWDILMIMLERRNLLQGPAVKKIRKIWFRSTCSLAIRRIIRTLLAGKWVQRPSNKDLSLTGNAEIILDSNL